MSSDPDPDPAASSSDNEQANSSVAVAQTLGCATSLGLSAAVRSDNDTALVDGLNKGLWKKAQLVEAMFDAVRHLKWKAVMTMIKQGFPINRYDAQGQSILHVIPSLGFFVPDDDMTDFVKEILSSIANSEVKFNLVNKIEKNTSSTALHRAVQYNRKGVIEQLLAAGARLDVGAGFYNKTPLIMAAAANNTDILQILIDAGAAINKPDVEGNYPLCFAAKHGHSGCLSMLLDAKARINLPNHSGQTALMFATEGGYMDCVQLLMSRGTDLGQKDFFGRSLLWYAVKSKSCDILQLVLSKMEAAKITMKDGSVFRAAVEADQIDMVNVLVEHSWHLNHAESGVNSALHRASEMGSLRCLKYLLENKDLLKLQVNYRCQHSGCTPLHLACTLGHHEAVELLLEHGAKTNLVSHSSVTPLFTAMQLLPISLTSVPALLCMKELIQWGCDVNYIGSVKPEGRPRGRRTRGQSLLVKYAPLDFAICGHHIVAAQMLLTSGARCQKSPYSSLANLPKDAPVLLSQRVVITEEEFQGFITDYLYQPPKLMVITRSVIRRHLGEGIPGKVGSLGLPTHIKDFVMLPELGHLINHYKEEIHVESEYEEDDFDLDHTVSSDDMNEGAVVFTDSDEDSDTNLAV